MEEVIQEIRDSRKDWTNKEWDKYNQVLAEAYEKLDEDMAEDAIEMMADY